MALIRVVGFDPAIRNLGIAIASIDIDTLAVQPEKIALIKTENEAGKKVRKSSDDMRRAGLIYATMRTWARDADVIVAEVPTGTQSARGAMSNGMMVGVLAAIEHDYPLVQVQPSEPKVIAVGRKTATKEEMIDWAVKFAPKLEWKHRKVKGVETLIADNEHMADALAIICAGIKTAEFRAAVKMMEAARRSAGARESDFERLHLANVV